MSEWIVMFDGPCSNCGTTLLAGTPVVWDNRARKMHCIECPSLGAGLYRNSSK